MNITNTESGRKLSNSAKLLSALMEATGVWCSRTLSQMTGIPLRTVQRLKLECATHGANDDDGQCATHGATDVRASATSATHGATDGATSATHGASSDHVIARAYKESLRDKILPTAAAACTQAGDHPEIEGLNGSTTKLVKQFAELLAGPLGTPDEQTAYDLLASNVEVYGAERVKIGFLEFRQKMAAEKRVRDPLRLFNGFLKGAKLPKADDPDGRYAAIDKQFARLRREASKPLEAISYEF